MIVFAITGVVTAALAGLIVGVRLGRVALGTHRLPEAMLAGVLLLSIFGANAFHGAATVFGTSAIPLRTAAMLCANLGAGLLLLFTFRVLRPAQGWVGILAGVLAASAIYSVWGELASGTLATPFIDGRWGWWAYAVRLFAFAWAAAEALVAHARLARQRRLGLVDGVTTHRILLWGLAAAAATAIAVVAGTVSALAPSADGLALAGLAMGILGIGAAALLWLAFFPPPRYARWIASLPAATETPG